MPNQLNRQMVQIVVQQAQQAQQTRQRGHAFEGLEQGHGFDSGAQGVWRGHSSFKQLQNATIKTSNTLLPAIARYSCKHAHLMAYESALNKFSISHGKARLQIPVLLQCINQRHGQILH